MRLHGVRKLGIVSGCGVQGGCGELESYHECGREQEAGGEGGEAPWAGWGGGGGGGGAVGGGGGGGAFLSWQRALAAGRDTAARHSCSGSCSSWH